jgi:TolB-like protein
MKQILEALGEAHARGIIHRDIKSANIIITPLDHVKILDFGLGRDTTQPSRLTTPGKVIGTLEFLSPEQARGEVVDHRSDLFSAGIVFFHMLTGHLPFEREQTIGTYSAILRSDPLPLSAFISSSAPLDVIISKALTRDPSQRYQSASEFLFSLSAIATTETLSIAVLYFDRFGEQQEEEYLRLGITEDIITDLSKISGVRVLSRHAVQKYKDKTRDRIAIARELGVRFLLTGTVEKTGEEILVKAELWDQNVAGVVWAQDYERKMRDIFDLQEEVAGSIMRELEIRLGEGA